MVTSPDDIKHIKLMISAAKKEPVNIAICMGAKPEAAVVLMHKVTKPDALAREAKAAGSTPKVARGTIEVDGTKAKLTCTDKPPTGIAKHLKAFFSVISIDVKTIELVDPTGKPISDEPVPGAPVEAGDGEATTGATGGSETTTSQQSSDPLEQAWLSAWALAEPKILAALQKDSPEASKIRAVQTFALGKAEALQFEAASKSLVTLMTLIDGMGKTTTTPTNPVVEPTSVPGPDRGELIRRAADVKSRLSAVDGPLGQKLTEGYGKAADHIKSGALEAAADLLTKLEATLAKIEASKADPGVSGKGKEPEPVVPEPVVPDPKFARISAAEEHLRKQVGSMTSGDTQAAMLAILDQIVKAKNDGEAETALAGLKRVQDGLKLQAEVDRLAPIVAKAASSGMVADVNALNLLFNSIADNVPAPDLAKAMAGLARVEEMIAAGENMDKSVHEQDQPLEIRPYAEARINWNLTREKLRTEIKRLEASIAAVLKDEGLDGEVKVDGALLGYIEKLDSRLEAKLAEIVNSDAGDAREKLKGDARGLIAEYNSELESDFFKDVDDANGFVSVGIASTARSVLNDLSKVLAA